MSLFYSTEIDEYRLVLDEEQSRHAAKVLRMKLGDDFEVTSGKGDLIKAKVEEIGKKNLIGKIVSTEMSERPSVKRAIAIAPTKNSERLEWFVEKAVEIGIDEIFFIETHRGERPRVNLDRMRRIIITAMKQCNNCFMPAIHELISYKKMLEKLDNFPSRFIAHCEDPGLHLKSFAPYKDGVIVFIGPEGDFTPDEVEIAKSNGFQEVSLGASRLRTETAGIYAITVVNLQL